MTATHFATMKGSEALDTATEDTVGRRFDQLVEGLEHDTRPQGPRLPRTTRRPTATRRGPVATPVQRCAGRPVLRTAGVPGPRLDAPAVRTAVRHESLVAPRRMALSADAATWRLTDRGIALVMAVGLVLMVAAVVAVVSTAITVTSEDYRPAAGVQQRA